MRVYGLSEHEAKAIVEAVSAIRYNGNVIVKNSHAIAKRTCDISIRTKDSRAYGSRFAPSGRHTPAASWEAYRDVIEGMFIAGATKIRTMHADYNGLADFYSKYRDTANTNVGSYIAPVSLGELTL